MPQVLQARPTGGQVSLVVRDLLAMRRAGQREAVTAIIRMVKDLKEHGKDSRYALPLKGLPVWELKTRSRGGEKGGARVYFFWTRDSVPILCGAETKSSDTPNALLLKEALSMLTRERSGGEVL